MRTRTRNTGTPKEREEKSKRARKARDSSVCAWMGALRHDPAARRYTPNFLPSPSPSLSLSLLNAPVAHHARPIALRHTALH